MIMIMIAINMATYERHMQIMNKNKGTSQYMQIPSRNTQHTNVVLLQLQYIHSARATGTGICNTTKHKHNTPGKQHTNTKAMEMVMENRPY
jgi:hypothetical protein